MNITSEQPPRRRLNPGRGIGWGSAVALILTPLVAMQFTKEVNWDETDFMVFAAMLVVVGLAIEVAVRTIATRRTRWLVIGAALVGFLWLWAELAVGVFTHWGS